MKFRYYLEQHIRVLLLNIIMMLYIGITLFSISNNFSICVLFASGWLIILFIYFFIDYKLIQKQYNDIVKLVDDIDQKYLLHEIIGEPQILQCRGYYYALRKAAKAMTDQVSQARINRKEYQEYIESWVHEIKTPIAALSLLNDNSENKELKLQLDKINSLVEQVLFYARSENTQNDYLVKATSLEDIVHLSLMDFRELLLGNNISLDIYDLDETVFTDEKWIHFILNQIFSNAIKYMKPNNRQLTIYSLKGDNKTTLVIKDNGIGIHSQELPRIFNAGYTGDDRKKSNSTGMGLYISKKLCDRLNLAIHVDSKINEYTSVEITFPMGKVHHLTDKS